MYIDQIHTQKSNTQVTIAQLLESVENTPMGDELKWLLKEGVGEFFESCDIALENMPTVSLALFM